MLLTGAFPHKRNFKPFYGAEACCIYLCWVWDERWRRVRNTRHTRHAIVTHTSQLAATTKRKRGATSSRQINLETQTAVQSEVGSSIFVRRLTSTCTAHLFRSPLHLHRATDMVVFPGNESPDAWDLVCGRVPLDNKRATALLPQHAPVSQGPVLIFTAAADPDALAAVRTLTALLKADLLRYEVHPVAGYTHLRDKFDVLVRGDDAVEPRAVLCVNCGAAVDLEAILSISNDHDDDLASQFRLFIIDSHRPYHLKNINSQRVVIFDDQDTFAHADIPITFGLENEWGVVPDTDSSDDEQHYSSDDDDPLLSDNDIAYDQKASQRSAFQLDDHQLHSPAPPLTDQAEQPQSETLREQSNRPASSNVSRRGDHNSQSHTPSTSHPNATESNADDTEDSEREEYLEQLIEDDVDLGGERASDSDEDEVIRRGNRKRRTNPSADGAKANRKRKRKRRSRRSRHFDIAEADERKRLREYYSSASVALSSACLSHRIASALNRSNIDTLWMAIVGATSQLFTSAVSEQVVSEYLTPYRGQVQLLNDSANNGSEQDRNTSRVQNVGYVPACQSGAVNRIAESVELRLDLLRHWTLYNSMLYSSYTSTRLATWRQTGKRRMLEMLATLGIPLRDSRQKWCYMKQTHKVALEEQLQKTIDRFDLGQSIQYESFVRTVPGHRGDISASDFVFAVTALLEFDEPTQKVAAGTSHDSLLLDRFWRAYDAMDPRKTVLLEAGLDMAISAQQMTAEIGGEVIERRKFVPSGPFRYVFLRDQQFKEFLRNPLLLRRLAQFLKTALFRQGAKDKPFIIVAPDTSRRVWIAVSAITYGQKNDFGHRFMKAAERNGSQITYDGFDSSMCEIPDGQEIEFVRYLHDVMR